MCIKLVTFPQATHEICDLAKLAPTRQTSVILHGYLGASVNLSKHLFVVPLVSKDLDCSVQIISPARTPAGSPLTVHEKLKSLRPHTPVALRGNLKVRIPPEGTDIESTKKIKTVEVQVSTVQRLNSFPCDILVTPAIVFPPEQRHLQLRTEQGLRDALVVRAKVARICRDELGEKHGFTEVETPLLFKSTPEGAREFIIPTRRKGLAYALPQSPQQFKQILMASGISKYYQFAKCFRDEDLRADRQPEFTQVSITLSARIGTFRRYLSVLLQLDLEMSFATGADVMNCVEALTRRLWKEVLNVELPTPFPRMGYEKAMLTYGSDKPDPRLGMPITIIHHLPPDLIRKISPLNTPIIEALVFPAGKATNGNPARTRTFTKTFLDSPAAAPFHSNPSGGPGIFIIDPMKPLQGLQALGFEASSSITSTLALQAGDLLVLQARPNSPLSGSSTPLGALRLALHKAGVDASFLSPLTGFFPLWITHFPLFTPSSSFTTNTQLLTSTHHPFTSPHTPNDVSILSTQPHLALADHYDLVLNGVELGGGSRRIHHAPLQLYILRDILQLPPARLAEFAHLVEVLRAGCPPHAGMALGFDRLVAVMLGRRSVRDVIAFPKSGRGEDGLVKSPGRMGEEVLERYHLMIRE